MSENVNLVLKMVEDGKITADEAVKLLSTINSQGENKEESKEESKSTSEALKEEFEDGFKKLEEGIKKIEPVVEKTAKEAFDKLTEVVGQISDMFEFKAGKGHFSVKVQVGNEDENKENDEDSDVNFESDEDHEL